MSIERFSKEQFENALPTNKNTGQPLWIYNGFDRGEETYIVPIKNGSLKRVAILIRSSVKSDGYAADTGEDSIRMWLVNSETEKPLAKKLDAYTKRTLGWDKRMVEKIRKLYKRGLQMHNCPKCNNGVMIERKGKYGLFYGCSNYPHCKHTMKKLPQPKAQPQKVQVTNDVADLLDEVLEEKETIKPHFTPSKYQQAIFDFVQNETGNAVVEAVAGSGKTTTIVQALQFTPQDQDVAFVAFNRKIANELKERSPQHVHVSTLHSLGFANIRAMFGNVKVENRKVYYIIKDEIKNRSDYFQVIIKQNMSGVMRLVSLLKATMLEPTNENLQYIADNYSINVNGDARQVFDMARFAFEKSIKQTNRIDYDDMIYFCAAGIVPCKKFDWLFIDECQDLNKSRELLVLNSIHENSRVIAVGDRKQSIYGWSGADTQAMQNLITDLSATLLPLSITYRCPLSHVKLAQELVPSIEACENAKQGTIFNLGINQMLTTVKSGDLVLCRTNAPLVSPAFTLIRKGIKAVILGRDIGKGLIELIEKIESRTGAKSLNALLSELSEYRDIEVTKLLAQEKESKAQHLEDQIETIFALTDGCIEIYEVKDRIEEVFSDTSAGVVFSSIHKSKGGEAERVFILKPELMPHPMAMKSQNPETIQQEMNIKYVALTRSKSELYFVTG